MTKFLLSSILLILFSSCLYHPEKQEVFVLEQLQTAVMQEYYLGQEFRARISEETKDLSQSEERLKRIKVLNAQMDSIDNLVRKVAHPLDELRANGTIFKKTNKLDYFTIHSYQKLKLSNRTWNQESARKISSKLRAFKEEMNAFANNHTSIFLGTHKTILDQLDSTLVLVENELLSDHLTWVQREQSILGIFRQILSCRSLYLQTIYYEIGCMADYRFTNFITVVDGQKHGQAGDTLHFSILLTAMDRYKNPELQNLKNAEVAKIEMGKAKIRTILGPKGKQVISGELVYRNKSGISKVIPWSDTLTVF